MLENIFISGDIPAIAEWRVQTPIGYLVSYLVAALAAHAACQFRHELADARSLRAKRFMHWGGAIAFGTGMWATHFIEMLAQKTISAASYDPWLTIMTLILAIAIAYGVLGLLGNSRSVGMLIFGGGTVLGLGMAATHYIGTTARQMDGVHRFTPDFFLLSIAIAIAGSWLVLWLSLRTESLTKPQKVPANAGIALILGAVMVAVHHTGVAGTVFIPNTTSDAAAGSYEASRTSLMMAVAAGTMLILILAEGAATLRAAWSEEELRDRKTTLRTVIENVPDAVITLDRRGAIECFNPAAQRLFGYAPQEVRGRDIRTLLPEARLDNSPDVCGPGGTGPGGEARQDIRALRKNQPPVPVELTVRKFELRQGVHFCAMVQDITSRKKLEEQLRSFIEEAPPAVAMFDRNMNYLAASRRFREDAAARRYTERYEAEGDLVGRCHYDIFPGIPEHWREAHQRALGGEIVRVEEERLDKVEASPVWLKWEARPWYADNVIGGIILYIEDITEQKKAQEEREAGIRALEISNRELDEFAHIVSHDLKEPLRGIRNQANFLLEDFGDQLSEDGRKRLQRMTHLGDRMQRLIEDLLFFSRLGRSQLAVQLADPNEIVHDVEHLLESMLAERNAKIMVPKPMPPLLCDKTRVTELFRNLITNAVKYNDKDAPIVEIGFEPEVATPSSREKRVYYVKDNGPGIPMEFHRDIFVMFKRLRIDGAAEEEGTGAGLAFVKKIVERHGGRIWLKSKMGEGTTFYFTLPQPAIAAAPQASTPAA